MIDLFADNAWDPFNRLPQQPVVPQQMPRIPPLTEAEENQLLPRIAGSALGGIGYVGSVLEKTFGSRAIRGLLAGRPREALTILPFSDTLGITREEDRVSGRDLLRKYGLAGRDDNWGNFVAGLATEIFTDPSMYVTFGLGALSRAGQVSKMIGAAPKGATARVTGTLRGILAKNPQLQGAAEIAAGGKQQLASLLDQPLGGLFGLQAPLGSLFGWGAKPVLQGSRGKAVIDAFDATTGTIGKFHNYMSSLPYGLGLLYRITPLSMPVDLTRLGVSAIDKIKQYGGSLFYQPYMGALNRPSQLSAEKGFESIAPFAAKYRERAARYAQELKDSGITDADQLRFAVEFPDSPLITNPELKRIAKEINRDYREIWQELRNLGVDVKRFGDPFHEAMQYGPRHWVDAIQGRRGSLGEYASALLLGARDKALQTPRARMFGSFKEGTVGINKLFSDPDFYIGTVGGAKRTNRAARAQVVLNNYMRSPDDVANELIRTGQTKLPFAQVRDDVAREQRRMAMQLARFAEKLPIEYSQAALGQLLDVAGNPIQLRVFGHNPIDEMVNYIDRAARIRGQAIGAHDLIANQAVIHTAPLAPGLVQAHDALRRAGLTLTVPQGVPLGAHQTLLDAINTQRAAQNLAPLSDLTSVYIPEKIAADLGRIVRGFDAPEALHPIIRGIDYLTKMFKDLVTSPWPAFSTRNLSFGQIQNLAKGHPKSLADAVKAHQMLAGQPWEGLERIPVIRQALQAAGRPVTPEEATRLLGRWMFAHGIGHAQPHLAREVLLQSGEAITPPRSLEDVLVSIPGEVPQTFRDALRTYLGLGHASINPKQIFKDSSQWAPVAGGHQIASLVENMNRTPLLVEYLRRGYTPMEAAREVIRGHYDYGKWALTPTEKTVMRRLFPFYTFMRGNIPEVIRQITRYPGGLAGLTARLAGGIRQSQQGQFIPSYLGEGLAIPIGQPSEDQMQRFLTRLDTPAENAFEFFKGTMRDPVQETLMGVLSQMNPIVKGPVEYGLDKQFFTGRELGDLFSMTGVPLLDHILFNSPFARFATTIRQINDPRKRDWYALPLNLLTGARVTDVDMEKYKSIAEREYIKDQLRGKKGIGKFETLAVRPEALPFLTEEEFELLRLQRLLEKRARERRKAGKEIIRVE